MNNGDGGSKKLIEFDWNDPRLPLQVFEAITDEDVDMQQGFGIIGILLAEQCLMMNEARKALGAVLEMVLERHTQGKTTADEPVPEPVQENLFE